MGRVAIYIYWFAPAYYHSLIRKELDLIQISSVIIYCINDMTLQFEQLSLNKFPDI